MFSDLVSLFRRTWRILFIIFIEYKTPEFCTQKRKELKRNLRMFDYNGEVYFNEQLLKIPCEMKLSRHCWESELNCPFALLENWKREKKFIILRFLKRIFFRLRFILMKSLRKTFYIIWQKLFFFSIMKKKLLIKIPNCSFNFTVKLDGIYKKMYLENVFRLQYAYFLKQKIYE